MSWHLWLCPWITTTSQSPPVMLPRLLVECCPIVWWGWSGGAGAGGAGAGAGSAGAGGGCGVGTAGAAGVASGGGGGGGGGDAAAGGGCGEDDNGRRGMRSMMSPTQPPLATEVVVAAKPAPAARDRTCIQSNASYFLFFN